MTTGLLHFEGLPAPVAVTDCSWLIACLPRVFKSWQFRFEAMARPPATPIAITRNSGTYELISPWLDEPAERKDPVDMACALVVELVSAYLEANQNMLCLHGAGVEIAGGMVIFPNEYHAGKSTLSACLAARGRRIIGDDILPMRPTHGGGGLHGGELHCVATGVAPRLRLPLPADLSKAAKAFMEDKRGPASKQYLYLDLDPLHHAVRGTEIAVNAIVLLERSKDHDLELTPVNRAQALRSLLWQNFARYRRSSEILDMLHHLVAHVPAFRLRYAKAEDAAGLLEAELGAAIASAIADMAPVKPDAEIYAATGVADFATSDGAEPNQAAANISAQITSATETSEPRGPRYVQVAGFVERIVDGERFLADPDGKSIHNLNETGSAIWQLLAAPISKAEIVDLFAEVFPDTPRTILTRDTGRLLVVLRRKGSIRKIAADPGSTPAAPYRS